MQSFTTFNRVNLSYHCLPKNTIRQDLVPYIEEAKEGKVTGTHLQKKNKNK